uniref:Complex III subunit II n=1 Tax=Morus alba TaxID=3498 RepID=Q948V5_MORAL|nr:mitochondrial processing peptidase alpha subunit [Morus alba]
MYRATASRLRALKARNFKLGNRFLSSAAVATSGGNISWLSGGGGYSSSLPSLMIPLADVKLPPPLPDHVEPAKTKITTLANGLKIASQTSVTPAASIGLYVDCGSIYETPVSFGASHLLERMAFKTTRNRSHLRVVREIEAIGGHVQASASREQMGYTFDALKTHVPEMVELLVDCARNPVFLDWEVNEQLQKVKAEISEASKNPEALVLEAIHSAGYAGALANPLLAPESAINRLEWVQFWEGIYWPKTTLLQEIVLAAYGGLNMKISIHCGATFGLISLLSLALRSQNLCIREGDYRCQADSGSTHFALAFEVPGGWHKEKEAIKLTVIQMLLGGGGSFSTGGPGKGMHSRLYARVLNNHPQFQSISAFSNIYNNTGIFGIQATTSSDFAAKAVDVVANELIAISKPGEVDQVQLDRAKKSTKSAILMNLESRVIASEDIGRQVLTYGKRMEVDHFLNAVDEVTVKDIASTAQKLLSSPVTLASYGDVLYFPSYDTVSSKFNSK